MTQPHTPICTCGSEKGRYQSKCSSCFNAQERFEIRLRMLKAKGVNKEIQEALKSAGCEWVGHVDDEEYVEGE